MEPITSTLVLIYVAIAIATMSLNIYLEHGTGRVLPPSDFAVYTNEQFGFTASLVDNTNNLFAFALPYPSGINLDRQTIKIRAIDFSNHILNHTQQLTQALGAYLSMLDEEFSATGGDVLADVDDEEMRAQFDGPVTFGALGALLTEDTAAGTTGNATNQDNVHHVRYFPWQREIDTLTPVYVQLVKSIYSPGSVSETAPVVTGNFTSQEQVTIKPIFVTRNLTSRERSMRNNQFQWMRLNS